jgi:hypothetical protein
MTPNWSTAQIAGNRTRRMILPAGPRTEQVLATPRPARCTVSPRHKASTHSVGTNVSVSAKTREWSCGTELPRFQARHD